MKTELLLLIGTFYQLISAWADETISSARRKLNGVNNTKYAILINDASSQFLQEPEQYEAEKKAGDPADLFATNQHYSYPEFYKDLSRRFVLQYPYKEVNKVSNEEDEAENNLDKIIKEFQEEKQANSYLVPVKAPPELVLAVAKESALLEASKPINPSENLITKDILRSGNYWDDVWQEDVNPRTKLRSQNADILQTVKVKIMPGSKLYQLVSVLRKISPTLVYVINKN